MHYQHALFQPHGNAKLTEEDIREIRRLYAEGARQRDLAHRFGVEQPAISKIVHGDHYKLMPGPVEPSRTCIDCGALIVSYRKRCDSCRTERHRVLGRKYYRENGRPERPRRTPKKRYGVMSEDEGKEVYVINREAMLKYGPYTYNHARYLASRWNTCDPFEIAPSIERS